MHLTFFIPDLLRAATSATSAGALARLLQVSTRTDVATEGALALLAPLFGVAKQHDWPIAALRIAAAGHDPGERYWLRATPVTLEAGRDDVHIVGPVTDLDRDASSILLAVLQRHFADDGLHFASAGDADWCVAMDTTPELVTHSLRPAVGDRLRPHLPTGADAPRWRRWGQEVEMLLHAHAINAVREAEGRATISGMWLQHGGRRPLRAALGTLALWGTGDADVAALAAHAAASVQALPDTLAPVLALRTAESQLVVVPTALPLESADQRYVTPAWDALRAGRVRSVDIIGDAPGLPAVRWSARRPAWLRRLVAPTAPTLAAQVRRALTSPADGYRPA